MYSSRSTAKYKQLKEDSFSAPQIQCVSSEVSDPLFPNRWEAASVGDHVGFVISVSLFSLSTKKKKKKVPPKVVWEAVRIVFVILCIQNHWN